MNSTLGAPSGASAPRYGAQSGSESLMSSVIFPLNRVTPALPLVAAPVRTSTRARGPSFDRTTSSRRPPAGKLYRVPQPAHGRDHADHPGRLAVSRGPGEPRLESGRRPVRSRVKSRHEHPVAHPPTREHRDRARQRDARRAGRARRVASQRARRRERKGDISRALAAPSSRDRASVQLPVIRRGLHPSRVDDADLPPARPPRRASAHQLALGRHRLPLTVDRETLNCSGHLLERQVKFWR